MIECGDLAAPLGLYSHVSRVTSGKPIYIAGQVGVDSRGQLVGPDDFGAQMRQTFENLGVALKAAGGSFDDVAKFTTYITRASDLETFMETRKKIFAQLYPSGGYPPNTLLVVSRLVKPELLIEIEAIAVV